MERQIKIAPSMLAADFSQLGKEVCRVVEAGADLLHLDVMDGHFVPNLTMGPQVIKSIRRYTTLPFDVHLMLTHPQNYIEAFADAGADSITFHIEVDGQFSEIIAQIKQHGVKAGIALRPQTPVSAVEPYLAEIDLVLPMSVEPGFGGQSFIMSTLDKMDRLWEQIHAQKLAVEIEADGGINPETVPLVTAHGVTILVAGTAIFRNDDRQAAIRALRNAALSS